MRFALALATLAALAALAAPAPAQEPKGGAFPRRLLFVQVSGYLYLNPLTHGGPGGPDRTREAATRLATALRVPAGKGDDQLFVLSDALADSPLPTRDAVAKAVGGFCDTTRPHDRVVLYLGGHAVEKDGKAYFVPLDGDPDAPATLLPVSDLYAKLKELRAAQKVVVWDVCRHNPERAFGRREPGPMSEALFKLLATPPEGVQVLASCGPKDFALEYSTPRGPAGTFAGSAYLDALRQAATDTLGKANPADAIPADALHAAATKLLAGVSRQKPSLVGALPKQAAEYDPKAAPAKRFELPVSPKVPAEVKAIFDELALPPLAEDTGAAPRLAFDATALKAHAPDVAVEDILRDGDKYPLRVATLRALQTIRNNWPLGAKEPKAVPPVPAPVTDRAKKLVADAQQPLAEAITKLELELDMLLAVANKRAKETKRWQAHYDLTVAELRLRLVVLNEFNLALARVRTETLPELADGSPGWRLGPSAKLHSRREVRDLFTAAQEGFAQVAADHTGTPWEVLARRSRAQSPGLQWDAQPPAK
ncbi:MAG: caspase family protein [Gemmataceae bacterium]|nr:caspase family protein [Gemmataceae bacterium]